MKLNDQLETPPAFIAGKEILHAGQQKEWISENFWI
jgi:hypothetical protein